VNRTDIAANEVAETLQLHFRDCRLVAFGVATGHGVDDAAQHRLVRRQLAESAREVVQFGHRDLGIQGPAHFKTTQPAQLDPDPFADQLTAREQFKTLENPAKRVRIVGLERRDCGGEGACVLRELADGVGLRGELADSGLLQSKVAHDGFLP